MTIKRRKTQITQYLHSCTVNRQKTRCKLSIYCIYDDVISVTGVRQLPKLRVSDSMRNRTSLFIVHAVIMSLTRLIKIANKPNIAETLTTLIVIILLRYRNITTAF